MERRLSDTLQRNQQVAMETGLELSALQSYLEKRQVPQLLDDMRQSGKRAADIVANMLQFSRQADPKKQEARLDELIEHVIMLASVDYDLKKKFDFRSIQIVRDYQKDLPPVPCQAAEIEQVLLNLFSNAAQAMSNYNNSNEPSRITVRTRLNDSRVRVSVEDNGPGMDEDTRRRIFEPFYTTKPPGLGTGLGLSVSYFIITEAHGGQIWVESSPGQGARFTFELP